MRLPKAYLRFLTISSIFCISIILASCALGDKAGNSELIKLPEEVPAEFAPLFEAYTALKEDHYKRSEISDTTLSQGAIRGMIDALNDVHAAYLTPELFSADTERFRGTFQGIGAEVSMKDDWVTVVAPIPNTPAERAGILPGDIILEVNGESTSGLSVFDVVDRIRGPMGTTVDLLVLHRNQATPTAIQITRDVVLVPTIDLRFLSGGIAHVKVQFFGENTSKEFQEALERIDKIKSKSLILDIRNNPGGMIDTVVDMASHFLSSGLVLYQVDGHGNRTDYEVQSNGIAQAIPTVVLINNFSASSSEIMAGALRDHNRAQLIGTTTFGKGSVNVQRGLSDGSGIYYSIAKWYTPNGTMIENSGIEPNIMVDDDPRGMEDFQLDKAIEILSNLHLDQG